MNKLILFFIFIFSTQSISEEWTSWRTEKKAKIKKSKMALKNKKGSIHAPLIKMYGKRKLHR